MFVSLQKRNGIPAFEISLKINLVKSNIFQLHWSFHKIVSQHHLENLEKSGNLEIGLKSQEIFIFYPESGKVTEFIKSSWWSSNKCEPCPITALHAYFKHIKTHLYIFMKFLLQYLLFLKWQFNITNWSFQISLTITLECLLSLNSWSELWVQSQK